MPCMSDGTPTEILNALKVWKLWETTSAPTFIMDQYAVHWEHKAPLSQGTALSPPVFNETSHRDVLRHLSLWGERHLSLWGERKLLSPMGPHFFTANLLKCTILRMEHWKRGEGRVPGLAYPVISPSGHIWQCCLPRTTHMVCTTRTSSLSFQPPSVQGRMSMLYFLLE